MDPILQEALAGEPVTVTLAGITYPLAFSMQGVILYKLETAKVDRARKLAANTPALTREAKRELRESRRKLLAEADAQRPPDGETWDEKKFSKFNELLDEAVAAKRALDEDAAAGDSLYDKANWWKISPEGDPERLLLALWVGLHRFEKFGATAIYKPAISQVDLGGLIDLRNGRDVTLAISKALSAHLIAPSETPEQDEEKAALPNVEVVDPGPIPVPIPRFQK